MKASQHLLYTYILLAMFLYSQHIKASDYIPKPELDKAACMIDCHQKIRIHLKNDKPISVTWSSSDEQIATVTPNGTVTGHARGDAYITATTPDGLSAQCIVSVGYEGQNPIVPPTWGLFIADGEPHVFNGRMYLFGSRDVPDGFLPNGERDFCSTDYHVLYSDDLIHWVDAGVSISLEDIPAGIRGNTRRLWAPDLFKSPTEKNKYYLTFCGNGQPMYIAESDSPLGPFSNIRLITLNGEPIPQIDPGVLVDDDGKVYLASPKFFVCQLDPSDYSKILPESYRSVTESMPTDNEPFEGPSLRKRNGIYYYIYIQNKGNIQKDGAVPTLMGYMTATQPLGPYTYRGVLISNYDYPGAGNIHGSIERFKGKWYVSYHMPLSDHLLTRSPCMDEIHFNDDGSIQPIAPTSSGVKGAFTAGEKIQSSSGVEYSGGRSDFRLKSRKTTTTENPYEIIYTDYPYTFYDIPGQWIGYRFLDFSRKMKRITTCVSSQSEGGILEIRRGAPDGTLISTLSIPDTNGTWKVIQDEISVTEDGKDVFYLVLKQKPIDGNVLIDWLQFDL